MPLETGGNVLHLQRLVTIGTTPDPVLAKGGVEFLGFGYLFIELGGKHVRVMDTLRKVPTI